MSPRCASALLLLFLFLLLLVPVSAFATHYYVYEDGSGDFATIGEAVVGVLNPDTILVGCGTYDEPDIDLIYNPYPRIHGLAGDPECVTLLFRIEVWEGASIGVQDIKFANGGGMGVDGEDDEGYPAGGGFSAYNCIFDDAPLWGANSAGPNLTKCIIRNSQPGTRAAACYDGSFIARQCDFLNNAGSSNGGAFYASSVDYALFEDCLFDNNSSGGDGGAVYANGYDKMEFRRCRFINNSAVGNGGAIGSQNSAPRLFECLLLNNSALLEGGGMSVTGHQSGTLAPVIWNSTLYGNSSSAGGGTVFYSDNVRYFWLINTIIAGSVSGSAVSVPDVPPTLMCCDIWGNDGGDWVGPIADSLWVNDNFSANPKFCNPSIGDFGLLLSSPCFDSPACGQVGAYGEGCVSPWTDIPETEIGPLAAGLAIRPNPFSGETTIRFAPGAAAAARLSIYDIRGREILNTELDGARGVATWDENDPSGKPVAPGVYFIRLETDRGVENGKVSLVR